MSGSCPPNLREAAFSVIQRDFPCEEDLIAKVSLDRVIQCCADSLRSSFNPFFIRITGQSGSGKSSQLLPAVQEALKDRNYIHLTIGKFAIFHPNYEKLQKEIPDMAREKTNGFALRTMLFLFEYCVENNISIVLDFSLLDADFEIYLLTLVKSKKYTVQMHAMSVPQQVSDNLIAHRWQETHRCVTENTARYTFDMLPRSLEKILDFKGFSEKDKIVLWSLCFTEPIICTNFSDRSVLDLLKKYRSPEYSHLVDFEKLLQVKTLWMKNFLRDL